MSRYRFELATPNDDADLRHVLAATPMEGRITVAFRREPSWFAGAVVDGRFRQVVACRDLRTGRIIGFGCRSVREVFVNGRTGLVGYLSSLRVLPEHRNLGLLARGYAAIRELHGDGRVPFYLTTIAAGNRTALSVLTSGRAGLPVYHPAGAYHTVVVTLTRRRTATLPDPTLSLRGGEGRVRGCGEVSVRPAKAEDLPEVLNFLAAAGPRRQYFPRLGADDFLLPEGSMRGLSLDKILLAERGGRLVGTLAGWDQHSYRQSVVCAYHGWLCCVRPLYNAWAWFMDRPALPQPGGVFPYLMGALPVVAEDDGSVFVALLEALRYRAAGGPWTHFLIGLHETDPLLRVARRYQAACYVTHLFLVCWPDGEEARVAVDDRAPYLEAGSL
jgi:hypothetical protein